MDAEGCPEANWDWVRWSAVPIAGNAKSATELSTKTVARETAISSELASRMGATAAMAEPPQMAVPMETRKLIRGRTREEIAESKAEEQREGDAERGVNEAGAARLDDLVEIHAETECDNGGLEQVLGQVVRVRGIGVDAVEPRSDAENERESRGKHTAGCENECEEEKSFCHEFRMALWRVPGPSRSCDGLLGLLIRRLSGVQNARKAKADPSLCQKSGYGQDDTAIFCGRTKLLCCPTLATEKVARMGHGGFVGWKASGRLHGKFSPEGLSRGGGALEL